MLECDHQFMGSREFCLACGQWNSDEHLDTAKHARRLMWFQEGKLHKQIRWVFDYVWQQKLPRSVLVSTANMMNSVFEYGATYNTVMNSKRQCTNLHVEAQAEHQTEYGGAPGLKRERANTWGTAAAQSDGGAAPSSNIVASEICHGRECLDLLVARVVIFEAECAELETRSWPQRLLDSPDGTTQHPNERHARGWW